MIINDIQVPNINVNPYMITECIINSIAYTFEYRWSIREQRVYLSIYKYQDENPLYIVKNIKLLNGINITKNVIDNENWVGELYFLPANIENRLEYNIDNFHTDYYLHYVYGKVDIDLS